MSGKKQHHIPQALQRGFLADVKNEKVYVYRRKSGHFPASIADVAAQRFFYSDLSKDGTKTLDDEITDYEDRLGGLLIQLRSVPVEGGVDAAIAAEVIAHLTPRSANMRRMVTSGMGQLLAAAAEEFNDEEAVIRILGLEDPGPGDVWNEHIARVLENEPRALQVLQSLSVPRDVVDRYIFMISKEHIVSSYDAEASGITRVFDHLLSELDEIVRASHNKALGNEIVSEARKATLERLEWNVRAAPVEGAILPDCVAMGAEGEGRQFLPYMMTNTAVSAVVMPITSGKLLVGVHRGASEPDLSKFNSDAAACSDELFISASNSEKFAELLPDMGLRWTGGIDALVSSVLVSTFANKPIVGGNQVGSPLEPISYQIAFDSLDQELDSSSVIEKVRLLISGLHSILNVERLDGITFTGNYPEALGTIKREFDVNSIPEGHPDHISQGVSTILVRRDGGPKTRIVLSAGFATALIADNQQNMEVAIHLLVAGLTQADTLSRIESALPGFLLEPLSLLDHDGVLYAVVRKSLRAYRYAFVSAKFGAEELIEQEFTNYVIGTFDNAYATLAATKRQHSANPNFPNLFSVSVAIANDMLTSVARFLGHRHGVGKVDFPGAETPFGGAMASRQLANWAEIFGRDLSSFWQRANWDREGFLAFNIHVERILWANGIVLWRDPVNGTMIKASDP